MLHDEDGVPVELCDFVLLSKAENRFGGVLSKRRLVRVKVTVTNAQRAKMGSARAYVLMIRKACGLQSGTSTTAHFGVLPENILSNSLDAFQITTLWQ